MQQPDTLHPLSLEDEKRLDDLYAMIEREAEFFIGYPCNATFDYSPLFRFLNHPINNVGDPYVPSNFHLNRFEPIPHGSLYYRRCWHNGANTTAWLGIAEEPGEMMFGADARIPLNWRWAFIGNFNYLLPSASGPSGQDEELWNVSLGIELTLGHGGNHCLANKSRPLFPLADNGSFLVRR